MQQLTATLARLVADPQEGDELLYAVPVCGPYSSFTQLRYAKPLINSYNLLKWLIINFRYKLTSRDLGEIRL